MEISHRSWRTFLFTAAFLAAADPALAEDSRRERPEIAEHHPFSLGISVGVLTLDIPEERENFDVVWERSGSYAGYVEFDQEEVSVGACISIFVDVDLTRIFALATGPVDVVFIMDIDIGLTPGDMTPIILGVGPRADWYVTDSLFLSLGFLLGGAWMSGTVGQVAGNDVTGRAGAFAIHPHIGIGYLLNRYLRFDLRIGYRYAPELDDWEYTWSDGDDDDDENSIRINDPDNYPEPVDLSGLVATLSIGFSYPF